MQGSNTSEKSVLGEKETELKASVCFPIRRTSCSPVWSQNKKGIRKENHKLGRQKEWTSTPGRDQIAAIYGVLVESLKESPRTPRSPL